MIHMAFLQPCSLSYPPRPLLFRQSKFCSNDLSTLQSSHPVAEQKCMSSKNFVVMGKFRNRVSTLLATVPFFLFPSSSKASIPSQPMQPQYHQSLTLPKSFKNRSASQSSLAVVLPATVADAPNPTKTETVETEAPSVIANPQDPNSDPSISEQFRVGLGNRFSFYLSEFLMWHPSAKVLTLFSFTLIAMYLGSFLYKLADPNRDEAQYPFWHSVRAIAAPFEDDWERNTLRVTSIALASFGMVVFAILVGMVTETVESAVQNADGEHTRVLVSDHIVVCGWSPHVAQMIKDVNSVAPNVQVVVLAGSDQKQAVIEDIRSSLPDDEQNTVRIYYRSGDPTVPHDLERVNAAHARKILLVNTRRGDPVEHDRIILSRALALRQNIPSFQGDIVAELNSSRDESLVKSILHHSRANSVETINTDQLLFRFMAQAIRQPGLADIVSLLMGNDPMSVFHIASAKDSAPQLIGTYFSEIRPTSIPGVILCGFVDSKGVHIGNGPTYGGSEKIKPNTQFLLLGVTKAMRNIIIQTERKPFELSTSTANIMQRFVENRSHAGKGKAEHFLVLGWRQDMESMLLELDNILPKKSSVKIVDQDAPDKLYLPLKHVNVELVKQRADRYENICSLINEKSEPYDHVIIIGSSVGNSAKTGGESNRDDDAKTLATLVYVNDILSKQKISQNLMTDQQPLVTVEFLHEDVAEMVKEHGGVANAVLPQNLGSKISAQTVRDNRLNLVWRELLSQAGREVYLRPVGAYQGFAGGRGSFSTVADRLAKSSDDIMIGYIPRYMPKVKVNPQESDRFSTRVWDENDTLIVLSKE